MKALLTVAGFDPSSGAGVTADLAVFATHGYFGISAITALTVQSTRGVQSVHPVGGPLLAATLEELTSDIAPDGIKIGMLATAANVRAVASCIAALRKTSPQLMVVLDPIIRASSGRELIDPAGLSALNSDLLPLVDWITPNRHELAALIDHLLESEADVKTAASAIQRLHPGLNLVVTGGDATSDEASDLILTAESQSRWLRAPKIKGNATHGTGCVFSSALLCSLVSGSEGNAAADAAKQFVTQAIRTAPQIGHGKGPLNLSSFVIP